MFLLLIAAVQAGLYFYARAIALSAAQEGVHAARLQHHTLDDGVAAAHGYAVHAGGGSLHDVAVDTTGSTPTSVRITVTGAAPSLLPGIDWGLPAGRRRAGTLHHRGHAMTTPRTTQRWGGERGSVTLELAVLAPVLLIFLGMIVAGGRVQLAGGSVETAAAAAQAAALSSARATLAAEGLRCSPLSVSIDTAGFTAPLGQPAQVRADVACTVSLADVAVPGLPGNHRMTATATSPIDPYRGRTG